MNVYNFKINQLFQYLVNYNLSDLSEIRIKWLKNYKYTLKYYEYIADIKFHSLELLISGF